MKRLKVIKTTSGSGEHTDISQYLVFNSIGIPDKEIVATSVVSSLKEAYPDKKIIVISSNPEIWLHNPNVFRVYRLGSVPYFFEDFIKNKNTRIFWQDPYATDDSLHRRKNLVEIWCDLCKIPWNKKEPELYFTFREYEATERMVQQNIPLNLRQSLCAVSLQKKHDQKIAESVQSTNTLTK